MNTHFAWARHNKNWRLVATGATEAEAYGALLRWIGAQGKPPAESAILPAGVRPERQGERQGTAGR